MNKYTYPKGNSLITKTTYRELEYSPSVSTLRIVDGKKFL